MCLCVRRRKAYCFLTIEDNERNPVALNHFNSFISFDSHLCSKVVLDCLMNTNSCNYCCSTNFFRFFLHSSPGSYTSKHRRHQNECVHLTCMRGHLQVFRVYMLQFILLSCSWWLIFTGLSWQSRRWKMLLYREKPELFSLSAVIYGEPVTGTTLTPNMHIHVAAV